MPKHAFFAGHLGLGDHVVLQGAVNKLAPKYNGNFIIPCKPHSEKSLKLMVNQCLDQGYDLSRVVILPMRVESDARTDKEKHIIKGDQLPLSWRDNKIGFYDHECRRLRGVFQEGKLDLAPEGGDCINSGVMEPASWHRLFKRWKSKYRCRSAKFFCRLFYHQLGMDYGESWNWQPKPGRYATDVTSTLLPDCPYVFVHDDPTRGFKIQDSLLPRGLKIVRASDCYGESIFDYIPLMEQAQSCHFIDSSVALLWDRCESKRQGENFIHRYVRSDCTKPYYDKSYWHYFGGPLHRFRGRQTIGCEDLV